MIRPISNYLKIRKKLKLDFYARTKVRNSLFVAGGLGGHHAVFFEFLLTDFLGASGLGGAGDGDLTLGENNLNVTWGSHVGVNATMGTVGTSTLLSGGVDLDVINNQSVNIETLDLSV